MIFLRSLAIFVAFAPSVPAATITSGTITVAGLGGNGVFSFGGSGYSVAGGIGGGWNSHLCAPCLPGAAFDVNGVVVGSDLFSGDAFFGGLTFSNVTWGSMNAARGSAFNVTGPSIILSSGGGTYHGVFSFSGTLCGTQGAAAPSPCVVDLPSLTGQGTVDVNVVTDVGTQLLSFRSATYTFLTPEPGTLFLSLAGAMMFAVRRIAT